MASSLTGVGPDFKRGGRSAVESAMVASGIDSVVDGLRDWGALGLFITAFTSKAVATSVIRLSNRHAPEDTGELIDSSFMDSVGNVGESLSYTTILENFEGAAQPDATGVWRPTDAALRLTNFQISFQKMDYFGTRMRTFNKYVVGYTADYAPKVHENEAGVHFRQPADGRRSGGAMRYPDDKTSHFLLNAFNYYKDRYSQAMIDNFKTLEEQYNRSKLPAPNALSKGGKPRLVPKR